MLKRTLRIIFISSFLLALVGCTSNAHKNNTMYTEPLTQPSYEVEEKESATKSGEVVAIFGGNPRRFELACEDGKNYGFVIDEQTTLIWEDKSAFSLWENTPQYEEWDVFSCDMEVTVVPNDAAESMAHDLDERVATWYFAKSVTVTKVHEDYFNTTAKPVIYLYPQTPTEVAVSLDYKGVLTCTYPQYENGWHITAHPDGTLIDSLGQTYKYLYWEGITTATYDFSQGFCIKGSDTATFLENALAELGLNRQEANEFIVYWLPFMTSNPYNLITFQTDAYTDHAKLTITPTPDTLLRVFMAWQPLEEPVEMPPQPLIYTPRNGFTVVEWGGAQVK